MVSKKTKEENTVFDKKVFRLITGCSGETIASISRRLGVDWHTVKRSINRLESQGKIKCVENSKNLKIYENAERHIDPYTMLAKEKSGESPTDYTPPMTSSDDPPKNSHFDKRTRVHVTGCYTIDIQRAGKMEEVIRDKQGFTIGKWNLTPKQLRNSIYYRGAIQVNHEYIKFNANQDGKGNWTKLAVYPNERRIYYANATVEAYRVMGEQVEIVAKILTEDGWRFEGEPTLLGTMHYGELNPQLLRYAARSFKEDCDNASLHADHSVPQGELEIYEDPFDKELTQDRINIIFDLPDRLLAMEKEIVSLYKLAQKMTAINQSILNNIQLQSSMLAEMGIVQGEAMKSTFNQDDRTGYQ